MYAARDIGMRLFGLIWTACLVLQETQAWGYKNGILHNSIWLEQAAGVYHRESRKGRYQLTYTQAKAVCKYEGGKLATYEQLEAARQIGFHVCSAGWFDRGRVGYPIVKSGSNCGFGKIGIVDYGYRLNKSERWDVYCYNPTAKQCGGVLTDQQRIIQSPGYPEEYEDEQICYWHIRLRYSQQIHLRFLEFDVEDDTDCLADYLEIYDSYDDVLGFVGRFCGDELPEDIHSTGNVMTLKFRSDSSVTAGGFQMEYLAIDAPDPTTTTTTKPTPFTTTTKPTPFTTTTKPTPFTTTTDPTSTTATIKPTPSTTITATPSTTITATTSSTTSEPFSTMTDSTSEPFSTMTDSTSEPFSTMTDSTSEPFSTMTDSTSEPFSPMTDSTSEPFSTMTDSTSEPFSTMTDSTSEPFSTMTDSTSEPFSTMTDTTSEPFSTMTDSTSEPFITMTDSTSEPFSPMTDSTSEPFSTMTDSTSEPFSTMTDSTSEPFSTMTDSTFSPNTSQPFSPMTDSTSEPFSTMTDSTSEPFSTMTDSTFSSNTSEPLSPLTDQ